MNTYLNHTPFVYKWIELSTGKWYIGSRTAKKCHPNDGYICSSKTVKKLITENPENWSRTIIATGTSEEILTLEIELLKSYDAKLNPMSYNLHNGDGKFTTTGKGHLFVGKRNHMYGRTGELNPMFGKIRPESFRKNKSGEKNGMYGNGHLVAGEKNGMYGKIGKLNPNYGKKMPTQECSHCNEMISVGNLSRHEKKCQEKRHSVS